MTSSEGGCGVQTENEPTFCDLKETKVGGGSGSCDLSVTKIETEPVFCDLSVTKTERFNNNRLLQLLNNPDVPSDEKIKLRAIKNSAYNFCNLNVTYKLGKNAKIEQMGRMYSMKGLGAQSLQRDIRNALYGEYYHDVDIANCQAVLLLQYCERQGLKCDKLKEFVNNRDKLFNEVCELNNCDRLQAKLKITALMFGGSVNGLPQFFHEYNEELKTIRNNVWNANKTKLKFLSNKPNFLFSCLAHVLQTEENKCLMAMDRSFTKLGRSMDVLIFDGGLVSKKSSDEVLDDTILQQVQKDVLAETNYSIQLAVKPMITSIYFADVDDEYAKMKIEFEKSYFRLKSPQVYGWLHNDTVEIIKLENLRHLEGDKKMKNGKHFLDLWLDDEKKLTYDKLVFAPKKEVPEGCFNLFTKFENEPAEGDFSAFTELLELTCSHDYRVMNYLENYFAHLVQKPYEKTTICICIQGEEGVGKDTLFNAVGKIFGKRYFFNTCTPENDIFHTFNTGTESAILVKIEEGDFKTNKPNQTKLKGMITSEIATYRKKGYDTITLDDYRNLVMTTNLDLPFVIDDTDRRFMLIKASSERRGDSDWWKDLHEKLNTQISAYHYYLLHKDISNFNPRRDRVETQAYRDAKSLTAIPYHATFFQRLIEELAKDLKEDEFLPQSEYTVKELYDKMTEILGERMKVSTTKFSLDLKNFYVDNGVTKHRTAYSRNYIVSPDLIMENLKTRQWWMD